MSFGVPEPNPPNWPDSVLLFHPSEEPLSILNRIEKTQDPWDKVKQTFTCENHFSPKRHALLFAPGEYFLDRNFEIGYYVQLLGLGSRPTDVAFPQCGPFVPALNKHLHPPFGTSLDTFWRSAENFRTASLQWAVSQAAPLRRVHVDADLLLHDHAAYASGGHLANAYVGGSLRAGGQQQFLFRNVEMKEEVTGGDTEPAITVVGQPKLRMEKPYITLTTAKNGQECFQLRVPLLLRGEKACGSSFDGAHEQIRDFCSVRVISSEEPINRIQEALDQGKDVVFAPGIFYLTKALIIRKSNQVILGLGLATLVAPKDGSPCIQVEPFVPGVRIAGLMLEASERSVSNPNNTETSLLEWGHADQKDAGEPDNFGGLFDIFCRVGGGRVGDRTKTHVDYMVRLHSGCIIGDNLWLWRADHGALGEDEKANYTHISPVFWQTENDEFRVETGIEVAGDNIHIAGLAVEHANGHQVVWKGDYGVVYFYQCELPYCASHDFAKDGFRGYFVDRDVKSHTVYAPGIYSNFRNDPVVISTAIQHPIEPNIRFFNAFTVKLDNLGGIYSIVNNAGTKAVEKGRSVRLQRIGEGHFFQ
ncbi:hypothetical protein FisN_23Lh183 [Fistulifera solaris]|uniref:Uncharacterized protein n=1 Tax=Fistulifera solaris TaxID=1519565 RepID=A0A1Z5K4T7_FISSO|nr:hypothetical protein FisN_23Lh183 [Fistulifera solaris]|eukprot:GAX21235.1 hypothetical protein FisN_23Lh183 [Fistulifera solaris]